MDSENMRVYFGATHSRFKEIERIQIKAEMQLSNLGHDDKRTTVYYKNKMKKEVCFFYM